MFGDKIWAKTSKNWASNYRYLQKLLEIFRKLRKSCNHKRNINRIYNEKLHYNSLQQLLTFTLETKDLRKLGNSGERKWKDQSRAWYPFFSLKIQSYTCLVENRQKVTSNLYFKSRCSVYLVNYKYNLQAFVCESNSFVFNSS